MNKLTLKGKIIIICVIVIMIVLIIVGIKYLPIWSTIEAVLMLIVGFFFGWMLRAKRLSKNTLKENDN